MVSSARLAPDLPRAHRGRPLSARIWQRAMAAVDDRAFHALVGAVRKPARKSRDSSALRRAGSGEFQTAPTVSLGMHWPDRCPSAASTTATSRASAVGDTRSVTHRIPGGRTPPFRGYADYALSPEFANAFRELCGLASRQRTAIMCAEALCWRCHRRLISDRLLVAGWEVCHIGSDGRSTPHRLTGFAVVQPDGSLIYPAPGSAGKASARCLPQAHVGRYAAPRLSWHRRPTARSVANNSLDIPRPIRPARFGLGGCQRGKAWVTFGAKP